MKRTLTHPVREKTHVEKRRELFVSENMHAAHSGSPNSGRAVGGRLPNRVKNIQLFCFYLLSHCIDPPTPAAVPKKSQHVEVLTRNARWEIRHGKCADIDY